MVTFALMDDMETYRRWCASEPGIPLFLQAVWIDAAAPGVWRVWTFEDGGCRAFFVYVPGSKWCMRYVAPPLLTPCQGFWMLSGHAAFAERCQRDLLGRLRGMRLSLFEMNAAPGVALPLFEGAGYKRIPRVTYRIDDLQDLESVWKGVASSKRRQARKGDRAGLRLTVGMEVAEFYRMLRDDHGRVWYPLPFLERLCAAVIPSRGEILAATDPEGRHSAAALFVWDSRTVYYLAYANPPAFRGTGASSWLVWQAMRRYSAAGKEIFDFEGSMLRKVAASYRKFGATAVSFDQWSKTGLPARAALAVKRFFGRLARR